jgi:hypothetical protein
MKRALPAARDIIEEEGPQTCFIPFVMSSSGGFGPAARAFLKNLYRQRVARAFFAEDVERGRSLSDDVFWHKSGENSHLVLVEVAILCLLYFSAGFRGVGGG